MFFVSARSDLVESAVEAVEVELAVPIRTKQAMHSRTMRLMCNRRMLTILA